jgi:TRAP-type C4-dicarboxylate transport system substrate-binding protein
MVSRRQLLQLSGIGCGAFLGGNLHASLARLGDEAKPNMINAIPGTIGEQFKRARFIAYHVTSQPADSPTFKHLKQMWSHVALRCDGWLRMIVLPDSGELPGADTEAVLATASGRFDAITVAGPAIDAIMPQAIPLQTLAFAYATSNAARSVLNAPLFAACMRDAALTNNLHCLDGLLNAGMRQMTTIKGHPLHSTQDFEGLVLRIPPSPTYSEQLQPLGIRTVVTPISDALERMRTGSAMGQENPVNYAVMLGFYKVCAYLNETNHFRSGFNTLINLDSWRRWPDSIQRIVQEEHALMLDQQWRAIEQDNVRATAFCLAHGMQLIKTDLSGAREKIRQSQLDIVQRLDRRLQPIAQSLISSTP